MALDAKTLKKIYKAQKNEITEYHIYRKLADGVADEGNKKILKHIAEDEKSHYEFWKNISKKEIRPSRKKISFYYMLTRFLGLSFGLRLMETGEKLSQGTYDDLKSVDKNLKRIIDDECRHEQELIGLMEDASLKYAGSIILGLNDALVELTGALAGLTLAIPNTRIIAIVGLITGIAASLSMAGSEYLSTKEEGNKKSPLRASIYTGISYIITVILLVLPYFLATKPFVALGSTLGVAIIVIFGFTFYSSVAKQISFKKKFIEMAAISLGVAALSFGIGYFINTFFHIEL